MTDTVFLLSDNGIARPDDGTVPGPLGEGSVPANFSPTSVVRCERGVDAAGNVFIAAVTLGGDVEEVVRAFKVPSEGEAGTSNSSCAFTEDAPVGLWLVSSDGSAIRPQWPTTLCGYQDAPLAAVNALAEASRTTVATLGSASVPGSCGQSSGYAFPATSEADAEGSRAQDIAAFHLMVPTWDVSDLTVCRYRTTPAGDAFVDAGTLPAEIGQDVVTRSLGAPAAEPCRQVASEVVAGRLVRPDGSGGGIFAAEVDGCGRFMVPGVSGYRQMPNDLRDVLAG
ncbi:hypothetical protein [Rhodococcus sp. NBC_00297]|uniref:hypothetical protein n=1 Tax=Rhodococcus sp. NBC_00297 TaxID=2976005 RepID=UPI002E2D09A1|nr:hypothetical protein [Rhodococcus sp. NBC_00297]